MNLIAVFLRSDYSLFLYDTDQWLPDMCTQAVVFCDKRLSFKVQAFIFWET
jgi:hypothetical protein